MTPIEFTIAVNTRNTMNGNFGNSRAAALAQAAKDRAHRDTARAETTAALRRANVHPADIIPAIVTLTRCSSGTLDAHDGLRAALKRVVDGIALALGINDGGPMVSWQYEQARAPRGVHGVHVAIARRS